MLVCLGEALVDLICERPAASLAEVDAFTPRFGGALANVAVAAERAGAETALVGAAGDDEWGRWLYERLAREGVGLEYFELLEGVQTPVAFVAFDEHRDPRFEIYGDAIAIAVEAAAPRLEEAIEGAEALVFGSTTMVEAGEREATLRARALAEARGARICFDPNIRPNRWGDDGSRAAEVSRELVGGSFLVRTNREEAIAIAGVDDPVAAAGELAALGAEVVVVTLGPDGAIVRGAVELEMPAVEVEVVSTLGAGDALMGTLVAGLAKTGWDAARAGEALGPALAASAEVCSRWSAIG